MRVQSLILDVTPVQTEMEMTELLFANRLRQGARSTTLKEK